MAKVSNLDDDNHIVRHVPWARLRKDEDDNVIGFLGQAFALREGEASLSAAWLEFAGHPTRDENIDSTIAAFQATRNIKRKDRFALGNVAEIKSACLQRNQKVRVVHEPVPGFDAHAALRQYNNDDELLELLAAEAWSESFGVP